MKRIITSVLISMLLFPGCKTPQQVTVIQKNDSVVSRSKTDTINIYERIDTDTRRSNDTVFVTKTVYKNRNNVSVRHDTVTVRNNTPVIQSVEKPKPYIPKWIKTLLFFTGGMTILAVAYIIIRIRS